MTEQERLSLDQWFGQEVWVDLYDPMYPHGLLHKHCLCGADSLGVFLSRWQGDPPGFVPWMRVKDIKK